MIGRACRAHGNLTRPVNITRPSQYTRHPHQGPRTFQGILDMIGRACRAHGNLTRPVNITRPSQCARRPHQGPYTPPQFLPHKNRRTHPRRFEPLGCIRSILSKPLCRIDFTSSSQHIHQHFCTSPRKSHSPNHAHHFIGEPPCRINFTSPGQSTHDLCQDLGAVNSILIPNLLSYFNSIVRQIRLGQRTRHLHQSPRTPPVFLYLIGRISSILGNSPRLIGFTHPSQRTRHLHQSLRTTSRILNLIGHIFCSHKKRNR